MNAITIVISKWREFNGKETEKTPNWFKVHVNIASSHSLFGLSPTTKWVWVCLLAEAKKQKSDVITLDLDWASHYWVMTEKQILEACESLEKKSLLRVNSESTPSELRDDSALEREEEREREYAFQKIYDSYPNKRGRDQGYRVWKKLTTDDRASFEKATQNYTAHLAKNKTEKQFILKFSNFVKEWRDWLYEPSPPKLAPNFHWDDAPKENAL